MHYYLTMKLVYDEKGNYKGVMIPSKDVLMSEEYPSLPEESWRDFIETRDVVAKLKHFHHQED